MQTELERLSRMARAGDLSAARAALVESARHNQHAVWASALGALACARTFTESASWLERGSELGVRRYYAEHVAGYAMPLRWSLGVHAMRRVLGRHRASMWLESCLPERFRGEIFDVLWRVLVEGGVACAEQLTWRTLPFRLLERGWLVHGEGARLELGPGLPPAPALPSCGACWDRGVVLREVRRLDHHANPCVDRFEVACDACFVRAQSRSAA